MRRNFKVGLVARLALEELEEKTPVAGEEAPAKETEEGEGEGDAAAELPPELGTEPESLETDLILVAGDVEELGDMDIDVDDATDVVEELEVAAESLRDIAANGGLDRSGARVLNLHLQSLYARAGMEGPSNTLAIESFGGTGDRAGTTTLAMEDISKKAGELWKAILDMIEKSIKFIKDMFAKMFDGAVKLKARAEATVKAAEAEKGEAKSKTFEKDSLVAALHVSGKVNPVKDSKGVAEMSHALAAGTVEFNVKGAEALLAAMEGGGIEALHSVVNDMAKNASGAVVTDIAGLGIKPPSDTMKVIRGEELPGGRALIGIVPDSDKPTPAQAAETRMKLGTFSVAKPPVKVELPVLSTGDIAAVAKSVIVIAEAVIAFKAKVGAIDTLKGKIVAEAKKQAGAANDTASAMKANGVGGLAKEGISEADTRALAKGAIAMLDQPMAALMPYQLNTGKAFLDYCGMSLNAYKAAATKPADKPAEKPAEAPPAKAA